MENKIYVVGLGPGGVEQMTERAIKTLKAAT
jgi:precorrin-2 methylase